MIKKYLTAAAVVAALALTGCSGASTTATPAATGIPSTGDQKFDSAVAKMADAFCGVLDEMGVVRGVPAAYEVARANGFTDDETSKLFAIAVVTTCPEYQDEIDREASRL